MYQVREYVFHPYQSSIAWQPCSRLLTVGVYQAKQMRNQNNVLHSALFLVESTVVFGLPIVYRQYV